MSENARITKKKRDNKNNKDAWRKLESAFKLKDDTQIECVYRDIHTQSAYHPLI